MPLIINQGKQDTTQDNKFNPIVEKDVTAQITELKLATTQTNTIEVTMRLLSGANKGRFVFDRINYDPTSDFSWKYRALRKAAGVPYKDNEPAQIDIEGLLLNKAINVDLGIRKGKNKDGQEQQYQSVTYKVPPKKQVITPEVPTAQTEDTPVVKQDIVNPNLTDDAVWD